MVYVHKLDKHYHNAAKLLLHAFSLKYEVISVGPKSLHLAEY